MAAPEKQRVPLRKPRSDLSLAVVLGAGAMGMAVARRLGERHRLLLADKDTAHLDAKVKTLTEEGHEVTPVTCDVSDAESVAGLARQAQSRGPLGVLAHVVGLSPSMADWRRIMSVNLIGATLTSNAFLPLAQTGTAAIFVASIAGHEARLPAEIDALLDDPLRANFLDELERAKGSTPTSIDAYVMSKSALIRLCRRSAPAWGKRGARIVSLSPGLISTPMGDLEFANLPAKYDMLTRTPLGRQGTMLEIADAVEFLSSDRASFITGTDLLVDGGLTAANRHPEAVVAGASETEIARP